MSYVALDDCFPDHPKVAGLSDKAFRLYTSVLCRCGKFLTDGEASKGMLVSVRYGTSAAAVKELVDAGLWEKNGDGYRVHDYLDWNPSRAQVHAKRDAAKERMHAVRSHRVRANSSRTDSERSVELPEKFSLPSPLPSPSEEDPEITSHRSVPVSGTAQLALTPDPKPAPKPRKAPTAPHPVLVDHYTAEFERLRGVKPPFGGREARAVKAILEALGGDIERAKAVVSNGLGATWGNPQTILTIANDPAKWISGAPTPSKNGVARPAHSTEIEPKTIEEILEEQDAREKISLVRGVS